MNKLDRKKAPKHGEFKLLHLPAIKKEQLKNGIEVKIVEGCSQPVCNISFIVKRGAFVADKVFIASATANLLSEGTLSHPGNSLPEALDFYGITVSSNATLFDTRITIRTLSKHIEVAISLLAEMILEPEFSLENFNVEKEQSGEGLKIANQKVNYLAHKAFLKLLFGSRHRFSRLNSIDTLKTVTIDDIKAYHKENYKASNFAIYLSGDLPTNAISLLDNSFGNLPIDEQMPIIYPTVKSLKPKESFVEKKGANQSAIYMGTRLVPQDHPDFPAINFLNVVLGGYFGSRLMTKLREEMGITYGINSYIIPRKGGTELFISSEVKSEATKEAKEAIIEVINILCEKEINKEELNIVKNYMMGSFANMLDSSFTITNQLLTLDYSDCKAESFNSIIEGARTMTPKRLKETAIKYLDTSKMVCSIAGKQLL